MRSFEHFIHNTKDKHTVISEHMIGGFLYSQNPELWPEFKNDWKGQWYLNHLKVEQIKELASQNPQLFNDVIAVKGLSLFYSIYEMDLGKRFISDIDLLVKEKKRNELHQFLLNNGYKANTSSKWKANEFKTEYIKILKDDVEMVIEVHTKLYMHHKNHFAPSEYRKSEHLPFLQLTYEEEFVFLCYHFAFQHTCSKLYWLIDIYKYVKKYAKQMSWEKIYYLAKKFKVIESIKLSFSCIEAMFEEDLCPVQFKKGKWRFRAVNRNFLLAPEKNKIKYAYLKHFSKDGLKTALWYDLGWIKNKYFPNN